MDPTQLIHLLSIHINCCIWAPEKGQGTMDGKSQAATFADQQAEPLNKARPAQKRFWSEGIFHMKAAMDGINLSCSCLGVRKLPSMLAASEAV